MIRRPALSLLVLLAALVPLAAGCSTNPATGESSFTAFMSPAEEARVGAEENPKVLKEFGGEYPDKRLADYVRRVGERLAAHAEQPDLPYRFTVVNSPAVNAFALPGGYVYVTRGLLALVESEAELAAVLGHELGHVNARHTAQRYSQSVLTNIGAAALGILTGSQEISGLAQQGAQLYLASYSRDQEREADALGIRYLRRAGYDTRAMAGFLTGLEGYERLQTILFGRSGAPPSFFANHPSTPERVAAARELATSAAALVPDPRIGEADYLFAIDGLLYGDDPSDGIVRGSLFGHPKLRFAFEVPAGFTLINGPTRIAMRNAGGAVVLFDINRQPYGGDLPDYLRRVWAPDFTLGNFETIEVNGLEGVTATGRVDTNLGARDLRLVAVRQDPKRIYRFAILTPPAETAALSLTLRRMTYSLRRLSPEEAAALKPLRVRVRPVQRGETAAGIAATLPFPDHRLERFQALNALAPGQALQPGRLVKVVE
jgi:predicted Zn-dependent protease